MFALRPMDSLSAKCSQVEFAMRVILQWDFAASCIWFLLRFLVYVVPVASTEQLLGFFRTCPEGPTLRKQFFDHQEEGNDKKILLRVLPWKSHAQSINRASSRCLSLVVLAPTCEFTTVDGLPNFPVQNSSAVGFSDSLRRSSLCMGLAKLR